MMSLYFPIMDHNVNVDCANIEAFKHFFVVYGDDADYDDE